MAFRYLHGKIGLLMGLLFITGISGTGKSAVRAELRERGYEAYGTDEDGFAHWVNKESGAVALNDEAEFRSPEFLADNEWRVDPKLVRQLADRAMNQLIFLCGAVNNEEEVWNLFGGVILLSVDEATVRHRVATRTTNDFGKSAHELELVLGWQKCFDEDHECDGAMVVDATRPIGVVVDEILRSADPVFWRKSANDK
jgi:thymidylate kinase